VAELTYIHK